MSTSQSNVITVDFETPAIMFIGGHPMGGTSMTAANAAKADLPADEIVHGIGFATRIGSMADFKPSQDHDLKQMSAQFGCRTFFCDNSAVEHAKMLIGITPADAITPTAADEIVTGIGFATRIGAVAKKLVLAGMVAMALGVATPAMAFGNHDWSELLEGSPQQALKQVDDATKAWQAKPSQANSAALIQAQNDALKSVSRANVMMNKNVAAIERSVDDLKLSSLEHHNRILLLAMLLAAILINSVVSQLRGNAKTQSAPAKGAPVSLDDDEIKMGTVVLSADGASPNYPRGVSER